MKIKSPIYSSDLSPNLAVWLITQLPTDHHIYVSPYAQSLNVLLNKPVSTLEVVADRDIGTVQILRALRDESTHFIGRLRKTKYSEARFDKALKLKDSVFDDYLDHAVNEFVLRKMGKGDKFRLTDADKWESTVNNLESVAERIVDINILQKTPVEVVKAFDEPKTVCFCDPPKVIEEQPLDIHIQLHKALVPFKGKAVVHGTSCSFYRRLYKNWRCMRKKSTPTSTAECFWFNY